MLIMLSKWLESFIGVKPLFRPATHPDECGAKEQTPPGPFSSQSLATAGQSLFLANKGQVRCILNALRVIGNATWHLGDSENNRVTHDRFGQHIQRSRLYDEKGTSLAGFTGYIHRDIEVITDYVTMVSPHMVKQLMKRLRLALVIDDDHESGADAIKDTEMNRLERQISKLPFRQWHQQGLKGRQQGCFISYEDGSIGQIIVLSTMSAYGQEFRQNLTEYLAAVSPLNISAIIRTIRALEMNPGLAHTETIH